MLILTAVKHKLVNYYVTYFWLTEEYNPPPSTLGLMKLEQDIPLSHDLYFLFIV